MHTGALKGDSTENERSKGNGAKLQTDDLICVTGAGGFIGGNLMKYLHENLTHPRGRHEAI